VAGLSDQFYIVAHNGPRIACVARAKQIPDVCGPLAVRNVEIQGAKVA
jgi:hypothetical protein